MGSYVVRYLKTALDDLMEARTFNRHFSMKYQKAIIDKIRVYCESLAENPYRTAEYEHNVCYRKAVVEDYLIFYQVDEGKRLVSVFRILHGARNIISIRKESTIDGFESKGIAD
jgi:addiction module RelE/StbE family toxin